MDAIYLRLKDDGAVEEFLSIAKEEGIDRWVWAVEFRGTGGVYVGVLRETSENFRRLKSVYRKFEKVYQSQFRFIGVTYGMEGNNCGVHITRRQPGPASVM
jgi:hypothetical protein